MIYKIERVTERHIYWHKYSTLLAVIQGTRCTFCIICKHLSPILVYLFSDYRLCFFAGDIYYFNFQTGDSMWDHPCDEYYKKMVNDTRSKPQSNAATHLYAQADNLSDKIGRAHV